MSPPLVSARLAERIENQGDAEGNRDADCNDYAGPTPRRRGLGKWQAMPHVQRLTASLHTAARYLCRRAPRALGLVHRNVAQFGNHDRRLPSNGVATSAMT